MIEVTSSSEADVGNVGSAGCEVKLEGLLGSCLMKCLGRDVLHVRSEHFAGMSRLLRGHALRWWGWCWRTAAS